MLVGEAQWELLVVGFSITDVWFRELLVRRGMAGVRITVVGDRISVLSVQPVALVACNDTALEALEDVEPECEVHRRMHGKVTSRIGRALIGSANFTASGLGRNVEFGVVVEGRLPYASARPWRFCETRGGCGWSGKFRSPRSLRPGSERSLRRIRTREMDAIRGRRHGFRGAHALTSHVQPRRGLAPGLNPG